LRTVAVRPLEDREMSEIDRKFQAKQRRMIEIVVAVMQAHVRVLV
jgi:hypothetical protein